MSGDEGVLVARLLADLVRKLLGLFVCLPEATGWMQVLVSTKGGDNYTAGDALKLLTDLNLTQQVSCTSRLCMRVTKSACPWCTASIPARPKHILQAMRHAEEHSADTSKKAGSHLGQRLQPWLNE